MITENKKVSQQQQQAKSEVVEINYYTDPLCCWSWGFEPQWRRLRYEFGDQIHWNYVMGGMIKDWNAYADPMNLVNKPIQMGPLWMEARNISGMPVRDTIWIEDYPDSSYPACIAVKSAGLQSQEAGDRYLRKIREALMIDGKNIAQLPLLLDIAASLSEAYPGLLDYERFELDFDGAGRHAFREDLKQLRYLDISRFPTLTMNIPDKPGVIITGYRPYEVLVQALQRVLPNLQAGKPIDLQDYKRYWGELTEREITEVT